VASDLFAQEYEEGDKVAWEKLEMAEWPLAYPPKEHEKHAEESPPMG